MYGEGLKTRSARYRFTGGASNGADKRCDGTTCITSPDIMYCLTRSTARRYSGLPKLEINSSLARPCKFKSGNRGGASSNCFCKLSSLDCALSNESGSEVSACTTKIILAAKLSKITTSSDAISKISGVPKTSTGALSRSLDSTKRTVSYPK